MLNADFTSIPLAKLEPENVYSKPTEMIISGLTHYLEPPLKDAKQQLCELVNKQRELVSQLHNENMSISEVQQSTELQDVFTEMKQYHTKLLTIKRDMRLLHSRCQKLKRRALKLKDSKPEEEIIISKPVQLTNHGSSQSPNS
ncbi:biogenesis of lysosome-related organelles complex 1 subunit 6 [Dendroctonus ponderosae]|nr:biogenesis of lysosome-related organelles complex 1 subunit 6 [Dendroctonus ponderosae]KAH1028068.1 hypothetical protein HUJ05_001472 [Dendroctonus ponderosae]KAH1028070.1 hypothetical protein HUJ05_001472 [Dendroctonus ponderosae]KAH1028071.1 hypothetical protein HUJ05_001472 [Dendroctonus ponderosae]KAH1028072.1 hypothetical protein HUJ05_001472 [Dendroctonus ponderosae]KAH1028073.1 hypothetical protein HUJ05_001472 [Dendroctonus ponderosae]